MRERQRERERDRVNNERDRKKDRKRKVVIINCTKMRGEEGEEWFGFFV